MITLVLARSRDRFDDWCREREIDSRDRSVRYVCDIGDLRGLGQRVKVVVDDSFYWDWTSGSASLLEAARHVEARNNCYPETDVPPRT